MGFLKTIAILVMIYYALKFIGRLAAPFLLKKAAEKMGSKFNQNFQNSQKQEAQTKSEGEVTVEKKDTKKGHFSKAEGEYIDFEDIKD